MCRFIITMFVYVSVARWIYAELQIFAPSVIPSVDSAVTYLSIPTHDKWDPELLNALVSKANSAYAKE